jgi:4-hydroxybenzoate polyprenyltransferase
MFFGWAYFFALINQLSFYSFIVVIASLLVWYFAAASFGYLINDLYDSKTDALAGKNNQTTGLHFLFKFFISASLIFVQLGSFVFILFFQKVSIWWIILPLINILLFILYSHPAFRLKEKPYSDIVTDSLYAHVLPLLITYIAVSGNINTNQVVLLAVIFLWSFIAGLRNIIEHQLIDFEFDKKSGMINFIHFKGYSTGERYIQLTKSAEFIVFLIFISITAYYQVYFSFAFLIVGVTIFMLLPLGENILGQLSKYRNMNTLVDYRLLYESGIFLASAFTFFFTNNWLFLWIVPLQLILFKNESLRLFLMFIWHRLILGVLYYGIINFLIYKIVLKIWILFKIFVNYTIYYFRKYILLYDDKRAKRQK